MENTNTSQYNVKIKKLPGSRIEITASIPAERFDSTRAEALKHIGAEAELPGFRKGHVPEKMLVAKIGEGVVLEEMAEIAIGHAYPEILIGEKIDALGRPEVRITKIALGNPLEFTLTTAVFPEIILPDYKKIAAKEAKKNEEVVVGDEDVQKVIEQIRSMHAARLEKPADESGVNANEETNKEGEDKPILPELNDAFVKTLGDFSSVEDFKTKLRENIQKEKTREAKDKKRVMIMESILKDAKIDLPDIIVAQELERMKDEFRSEVERMGMTFDAYIKATGKTQEEMEKEWKPDAEKRAKVQLVISTIAKEEGITPDKESLERESAALRERYPDANADRINAYLTMILTNEKVFEFLEKPAE